MRQEQGRSSFSRDPLLALGRAPLELAPGRPQNGAWAAEPPRGSVPRRAAITVTHPGVQSMSTTLTVVAVILALACFFVIVWSDIKKRRGKKKD